MEKTQSQMLKGIAILLMIFLHLFNQMGNVDLCKNFIYIGGTPLIYILSRAANPVPFFLILGGYGLYKVFEKGDKHRWSRLGKLYIHYWIILLIFVVIGHFIYPNRYPGSCVKLLANIASYDTSYNGEMWFLLPYAILSACAPILFRLILRIRAIYVVAFTLCVHICTSYCISRYGAAFLFGHMWAYNLLLVFHLLFNFCLGAMAARTHFFERFTNVFGNKLNTSAIAMGGVLLIVINCVFKYNFFYAFGIITCLLLMPLPQIIKAVLQKLGDQSMNMWMIHSWFCYYLFHNFIYSFAYPIVIFMVLTAISYFSSLIINRLSLPIERLFLTRKEIKEKPIL